MEAIHLLCRKLCEKPVSGFKNRAEGNTLPQKTLKFSQIQKRDRNLIMASQLPLLRRVPMGIFLALLMPRRSGEGPG